MTTSRLGYWLLGIGMTLSAISRADSSIWLSGRTFTAGEKLYVTSKLGRTTNGQSQELSTFPGIAGTFWMTTFTYTHPDDDVAFTPGAIFEPITGGSNPRAKVTGVSDSQLFRIVSVNATNGTAPLYTCSFTINFGMSAPGGAGYWAGVDEG